MARTVVMDVATRRPAEPLRSVVSTYLGYRMEGFAPGVHQGLPSRSLMVHISLGAPIQVSAMPAPTQAPAAFRAPVGGLHAGPVSIAHDGTQHGISIELSPFGARQLLGLPAAAIASTVVDLEDLLGTAARTLVDQLHEAVGWAERFALLDRALVRMLGTSPPTAPEISRAWERIVTSGGAVSVQSLAAEVGWSRRHLGERFRAELGLSPKVAARVVRFERSVKALTRPGCPGLAEVAAVCGYADQPHLNREWRALAGCSPTQWLAEELPNVQDRTELPVRH